LATSPLRLTTRFFSTKHLLSYSFRNIVSDEQWVCSLLTIAAGPSQSHHSQVRVVTVVTTLFCLEFETLPTWRARSPYLYPPGTRWPSYTLRHWVLFVVSYDSQSYGGGSLSPHRKGQNSICFEHLPDTSRRTEERTLSVKQCEQRADRKKNIKCNTPKTQKAAIIRQYH
jgi:hypothetical protein